MKTAQTRRKQKNPFPAARTRAPKRAAARVKSGKPRKAAAPRVKHTKLRTPSAAAVKRRRAAQADAPRAKRTKARSFYKPFAERGKSRENMRRHMTIKKSAPITERFINFGCCAKLSALLPHHHKPEDLRFVQHVFDFDVLVRHVGAVDFLAPDGGGDSGAAEEGSAGRAADAAYFRLHAGVDLGEGRKQRADYVVAFFGRSGGLFHLREFAGYFDFEFLLRLLYLRVDDFRNFLKRHGGQDAAVEAEYFAPRHGVYVRDVRAAARRLEGRLGGIEEAVALGEGRVQRLVESDGERVRGAAGVVSEVRRAAVDLFALDGEFHPTDALFSDFDEIGVLVAHVGDYDEVVPGEESFLEQVAYSVFAAHFFVGDEGKANLIFRRDAELLQRAERVERRDELLSVVAGSASVDAPVLDFGLERVGVPQRALALGHYVHVRDYPEAALGAPREAHDEVRTLAARRLRVGQRVGAYVAEAELFELLYQILGFVELADAAVGGAYRRYRDKVAEGLYHLRLKLFYLRKKFFFQDIHLVLSVFDDASR